MSTRPDAEGLIGTGKIVKVQSKSGSSYVIKDDDESFASPVAVKGLHYWSQLNVPIIYVVYHPDDDSLYWKDVKAYLADRPDAFTPPHRIKFDKTADRFDESAYPALCDLCEQAPERVSTETGEKLYTNLLPVLHLPKRIWVAPVLPEKQPRFHDRLTGGGIIPPYIYKAGMLITLTDPSITGTALTDVIDAGTPEDFDLEDWLAQSENNEGDLRALLNSLLHRHLRRLGLEFQKDPRRYFFNKGLAEDAPIRRPWTSSRTSRTHSRLVAKHYAYGRLSFYRHQALDARFEHFGNPWAIGIYPGLHFSVDGVRQWMGDAARSYAIRARSEQYNDVYLNNLLFWANQISGGQSTFDLNVGIEPVTTVSGVPLTVDAGFCIRSAAPTNRKRS